MESIKGGSAPGTYGTKLVVYKYAGWISPEFEVHVYNTFDQVVTGQLTTPRTLPEALRLAADEAERADKAEAVASELRVHRAVVAPMVRLGKKVIP